MMHIILTRNHVSPHPSHLISCRVCRTKSKTRFAPHCYPCRHAHLSVPYPYQTLAHIMATSRRGKNIMPIHHSPLAIPCSPRQPPAWQPCCQSHQHISQPNAYALCIEYCPLPSGKLAVRWRLLMHHRHSVPQHLIGWDSSQLPCGLNRYLSGRIISTGRDSRATHCATRLCSIDC